MFETAKRVLMQPSSVGVIPTDTLYGIVGSALSHAVVERIYELRRRERDKPLIVLLPDVKELSKFQVELSDQTSALLKRVWPGPVSVIVPVTDPEWAYLHRGSGGIAFRVPKKPGLQELLRQTGPLVAPSANLAGEKPAATVAEAQAYFGDAIFYLDEGRIEGEASALVDARGAAPRILRAAPGFQIPIS
jgi:L-threonylcarbamoyladenylate synthase